MQLQATKDAADLLAFLRKVVTGMAIVRAIEWAIQAWSLDVVIEGLFIDPFVNAGATLGAFEVSFGFLKMVLVWCWGRVDLGLMTCTRVSFFVGLGASCPGSGHALSASCWVHVSAKRSSSCWAVRPWCMRVPQVVQAKPLLCGAHLW